MADGTVRGELTLTSEQALRGLRDIRDTGREADKALESLGARMDRIGMKTVRPRIDLTGIDAANAKLTELEARLDRLSRRRFTPSVGISGSIAGFGGGGGGGGGQGLVAGGGGRPLFGSLGGLGGALPWWALAAPFAPQLLGGAAALAGSAGSAALGAGVVGLGGAASLGAGAGLTMAVARPAITALGQIATAQQRYNTVVQEYGRASAQATTAARAMNAAIAANPAAVGASRQLALFRSGWNTATAPARQAIYGGISNVLYAGRQATPTLGSAAFGASTATAGAASSFAGFLAQPGEQAMLLRLTGSFAQNLPIAERSLENIVTAFGHLAVDATPFFREANLWVENWTTGLAARSANTGNVSRDMTTMAQSAKDWARLLVAGERTLKDIFSAGRSSGDSMVVQLTHSINSWDRWIQNNPTKVRQFFTDAETGVGRIATVIGNLVSDVFKLMNYLQPIFARAEQFIAFASGLGGGNLALGGALLYGGYEGLRGAVGGRGPSAGGALGSFVFGSPRGLTGGGRAAGGAVAPAVVPGVARATRQEVQAGVTGSGAFLMGPATEGPYAQGRLGQLRTSISGTRVGSVAVDAASAATGAVRGLLAGAARFALPLIGIQALLAAAQPTGGGVAGHLQNVGSSVSLGLLPGYTSPNQQAQQEVQTFLSTLPYGTSAMQQFSQEAALIRTNRALTTRAGGSSPEAAAAIPQYARLQANTLAQQANSVTTPQGATRVRQLTAQVALELPADQRQKFQTYLAQIATTASQNAGAGASSAWETAFTTGLERGKGPQQAVNMLLGGIGSQVRQLGPTGAKAFAQDTATWATQLQASDPRLQKPLDRLMQGIVDDINKVNKTVGDSFDELKSKVFFFNGQILTGSSKTWSAIGDALVNPMNVAEEKLSGTFKAIQQQAINALTGMGYNTAQARQIVTQLGAGDTQGAARSQFFFSQHGGPNPAGGQAAPTTPTALSPVIAPMSSNPLHHARGGMLSGQGGLDTLRLPNGDRAAPGEAYIANRHTMNDLTRATLPMFGKTAWQMIRDESRMHAYQTGGGIPPTIQADSVAGHPELKPGISRAVAAVLGMFPGLSITSTTQGGHASGSYHYLGEAADVAADAGTMYRAAAWIGSSGLARQLTEGIHNPNLSVKFGRGVPSSVWGASTWAEHLNHIHMAVAGGANVGALTGGAVGGGGASGFMPNAISLRAPASGLAGVPGALADSASRAWAFGMSRAINQRTGAAGISAAGFTGGGGSAANQTLGRRMMLAAGWGADQWPALQALWNQESGWSSTAVNSSSGAYGIPQALGHGHPFNIGDAPAQIAWGLNYIRGRYGSPAGAWAHEQSNNWYQRGGRVNWAGWNARGGSYSVTGPTLFGAGEKGREDVTITPAGKGGRTIHIDLSGSTFLGSGSRAIESMAEQVAQKIIDALDGADSGTSDHELMGAKA